MLDPLQNILDCVDVILYARRQMASANQDVRVRWLAQIGELDHATEIQRQLTEARSKIGLPRVP